MRWHDLVGTIGLYIEGTKRKEGDKDPLGLVKRFPKEINKTLNLTSKRIAELALKKMIEFVPKDSGRLKNALSLKKEGDGSYVIYVKDIDLGITGKHTARGTKAGRTYPLSQERGFKSHWIHTSMIAPDIRSKFEPEGEARFIHVKKATPYALPAYLSISRPNKNSSKTVRGRFNKDVRRAIKSLVKRATRKKGIINVGNFKK